MIIKCKICGNDFKKTTNTLTCSEKCRKINNIAFQKQWNADNKERLQALRKNKKKSYKAKRGCHFKHRYGITLDQYDQMAIEQQYKCKICDKKPELLHVDHCHKTGKVRGLLCNGCNRGLGFFNENAEALIKAAEYLKEHNVS